MMHSVQRMVSIIQRVQNIEDIQILAHDIIVDLLY